MAERTNPPSPPWWDGPVGRSSPPVDARPPLPWVTATAAPALPGFRRVATVRRPVVLLAVGVLAVGVLVVGVLVVVVAVVPAAVVVVRDAGGEGPVITTPFLSYTPPPGWSAAPPDADATVEAPALVGVVHGPRYTCGGEQFVRGFAAAALLPTQPTAGPAERVARWFAATTFSTAKGAPPDVAIAPPLPVAVAGPDGPITGTVTEAVIRAPPGRDGCAATAGRVLVLAVPHTGGTALLLVAGDTAGGPADPAVPDPATLDAVAGSVRLAG